MAKGGSKVVTGIISFLLGFLFALIVEIGAIVGVVVYVMKTDLETLLDNLGMGDNEYINTDPETGGAETLGDLVTGIKDLVIDPEGGLAIVGKSFDEISALIPATDKLLDMVYGAVDGILTIDHEEFESTPLTDVVQVLSDSLMYSETYGLLEKLEMDSLTGDNANVAIKSLLLGAEAEYATVTSNPNLKLPVLNDIYVEDPLIGYSRKYPYNGSSAYPANLNHNYDFLNEITDAGDQEEPTYRLYYVPCRVTENGVYEATYEYQDYVIETGTGTNAKTYKYKTLKYGDDTDFIVVAPDSTGKFTLNYEAVWAAKNPSSQNASDRFEGYSYYEDYARNYFYSFTNEDTERKEIKAICGFNYFKNNNGERINLDPLTLTDVISDTYSPLYAVPVSSMMNGDDEIVDKLFGKTTLGALMDGKVDMQKIVDDVEMSAFINNVSPDNKIMSNIIYKLSDVDTEHFTATYDKGGSDEQPCKFTLDNGHITEVLSLSGTVLEGAKISDIATVANNLKITTIMDVKADDAILMYVGYGVSDVVEQGGALPYEDENGETQYNIYTHEGVYYYEVTADNYVGLPCYIATNEAGAVTNIWYFDDPSAAPMNYEAVPATTINNISSRISALTDHVALPGVIDVDPSQSIITYVGYGITGVEQAASGAVDPQGTAYAYSGEYKTGNSVVVDSVEKDEVVDCYITVSGNKVASAWYYDTNNVKRHIYGTKIGRVPDRIESMKDDMVLGDIITIEDSDPKMLQALKDTSINGLNGRIQTLTVGDIFEKTDIDKSPMLVQLRRTKVIELATAVDKLMIQQIYSHEIYRLPKDDDPMLVVAFDATKKYYVSVPDGDSTTKFKFVPVGEHQDGVLTQTDYNNTKATTTYYTYGKTELVTDADIEAENLKMQIVGYDAAIGCGEWIYYTKQAEGQEYVVADKRPVTVTEAAGTQYYSYGPAKGMWRLILFKGTEQPDGTLENKKEEPYTINNFNNMVNSAAKNVYNATLGELQEAGVIGSSVDLTKSYHSGTDTEKLADMSFRRLIEIIVGLSSGGSGS